MDQYFHANAVVESPVGSPKQDARAFIDKSDKLGMTAFQHNVVEAVTLPTSPNTVVFYMIVTAAFGDCSAQFTDVVVYTMQGDQVLSQRSYWDASTLSKCMKKKEL